MQNIRTVNEEAKLIAKKLGGRIKEERKRAGLTQEEFGDAVSKLTGNVLGQGTVSQWETGRRVPGSIATIVAISRVLGCTIGYLLGDYDEEKCVPIRIRSATGLSEETVCTLYDLRKRGAGKELAIAINAIVSDYRDKAGNESCKTLVDLVNTAVQCETIKR